MERAVTIHDLLCGDSFNLISLFVKMTVRQRSKSRQQRRKRSSKQRKRTPTCVLNSAKRLKISIKKAQKSYDRGIGAWHTNPSSVRNTKGQKGVGGKKMTKEQWACARVNKLTRGGKYDQDLLRSRRKG